MGVSLSSRLESNEEEEKKSAPESTEERCGLGERAPPSPFVSFVPRAPQPYSHLVSGFRFQVSGFRFPVSGFGFRVSAVFAPA